MKDVCGARSDTDQARGREAISCAAERGPPRPPFVHLNVLLCFFNDAVNNNQ